MDANVGDRFKRLRVVSVTTKQFGKRIRKAFICECDCGAEKCIASMNFGKTQSCGCLMKENLSARTRTHGESKHDAVTPEYNTWKGMKQRCYDPNVKEFQHYGERGITVCQRWLDSYEDFLTDMGRRPSRNHSIDRKEVNIGYTPENCKWATTKEQNRNRTNSRWLEFNGHRRTVGEWAEVTGFGSAVILARLKHGWPVYRVLSEAIEVHRRRQATP